MLSFTAIAVFGIIRKSGMVGNSLPNVSKSTPAAIEINNCLSDNLGLNSDKTVSTNHGLTARIRISTADANS